MSWMKLADNDRAGPSGAGLVFFRAARVPSVATPPVVSPKTSPRVRSGCASANPRQLNPPMDWATKKVLSISR